MFARKSLFAALACSAASLAAFATALASVNAVSLSTRTWFAALSRSSVASFCATDRRRAWQIHTMVAPTVAYWHSRATSTLPSIPSRV
ncbi:hypothetical protein ASF18_01805 [Methylobacterium sp. Leaf89]|nr:hypothetical protein ASF18_01805 [Methylobacterium sp. Leaf89]